MSEVEKEKEEKDKNKFHSIHLSHFENADEESEYVRPASRRYESINFQNFSMVSYLISSLFFKARAQLKRL